MSPARALHGRFSALSADGVRPTRHHPAWFHPGARLELAASRLEREDKRTTVTEVACDVGFNDLSQLLPRLAPALSHEAAQLSQRHARLCAVLALFW